MKNKSIIIIISLIFFCTCWVRADKLILNDGEIIEGRITSEDAKYILIKTKTGWQRIKRKEINKVEYDYNWDKPVDTKAVKEKVPEYISIEDELKQASFKFSFGPKFGMFKFTDEDILRDHKEGNIWGMDARVWLEHTCIQFEFENFRSTSKGLISYYDSNGAFIEEYDTNEKLSLTPLWLSAILKGNAPLYGFVGAGMGLVVASVTLEVGNWSSTLNSNFSGYQFLAGLASPHLGLMVKYSKINSDTNWSSYGLGGYTAVVNLYF